MAKYVQSLDLNKISIMTEERGERHMKNYSFNELDDGIHYARVDINIIKVCVNKELGNMLVEDTTNFDAIYLVNRGYDDEMQVVLDTVLSDTSKLSEWGNNSSSDNSHFIGYYTSNIVITDRIRETPQESYEDDDILAEHNMPDYWDVNGKVTESVYNLLRRVFKLKVY